MEKSLSIIANLLVRPRGVLTLLKRKKRCNAVHDRGQWPHIFWHYQASSDSWHKGRYLCLSRDILGHAILRLSLADQTGSISSHSLHLRPIRLINSHCNSLSRRSWAPSGPSGMLLLNLWRGNPPADFFSRCYIEIFREYCINLLLSE